MNVQKMYAEICLDIKITQLSYDVELAAIASVS